jgi:chromosome segregation ATPase
MRLLARPAAHPFVCIPLLVFFLTSCQSAYYKTMEKLGVEKRDILVSRVEDARNVQEEAKDQFNTALERFSAVVNFQGGELEARYNQLKTEFERCESRSRDVTDRINAVEDVADDLFEEWEAELAQYSNAGLRRSSEQKMEQTRRHYERLIRAMRKAEAKINPVLSAFRDQVLFLKHNLNARAIASLHDEMVTVKADVARLVREMEASITEADEFIRAMGQG